MFNLYGSLYAKNLVETQRREEVVIESPHIIILLCQKGGCFGCESFYYIDLEPYPHVQENWVGTWECRASIYGWMPGPEL